ncbi:ubiquitin-specific protease UBP7 NDAI_0F00200 [Naumovozyma dairenensis CBS 421]|uniref:ubiquitinyl hydrolase 1 n=1 Tax=Naumovozyma dairenensis (strain ATCC 10597 / BCRC 20456 / CBS 421 / NBRC 0211 / NRRL Y-12639) TaxID=1071378 RepID=G0WC28_NAUDC|nr:hypothetical protein NDAI_0F00200 [Naumovozyma dairenensis CBS 421]CCD25339.1 hypothetical protein NDAI_0F00200 [Naumovozyma dairenensis CBS 421]
MSVHGPSPFTPEYSNELLQKVQSIYHDDIKHYYPQLKLEKLLDLLEHTEYLLELFFTYNKNNTNNKDVLTAFIVGCYYLFLIIPQSIQFQSKNKSYGIYTELKKLYENETHMTNVLLMVKDEIENVLDMDENNNGSDLNHRIIKRQRAYSISINELSNQVKSLSISNSIDQEHINNKTETSLTNQPPNHHLLPIILHCDEEFSNEEINATDFDRASPLWTAPSLEPKDQLKLAYTNNTNTKTNTDNNNGQKDSTANDFPFAPIQMPFDNGSAPDIPPKIPITKATTNIINNSESENNVNEGTMPFTTSSLENINNINNINNYKTIEQTNPDRASNHRKDSYHSIYMVDDGSADGITQYYDSNPYIHSLERLQKQCIITAQELFSILSNPIEKSKLLLIDLRFPKRFSSNHIVAPNLIMIDPMLLWNSKTNTPIYDITTLENLLYEPKARKLLQNRTQFEYIVFYTDNKTYMNTNFDYSFTFFYLLVTSKTNKNIKSAPTHLLGGYDKWKKVLYSYSEQYNFNMGDYLYKPHRHSGDSIKHHDDLVDSHILQPPSWKPPELPLRMRKRPPPPPPVAIPTPPVPHLLTNSTLPPISSTTEQSPGIVLKTKTMTDLHSTKSQQHRNQYLTSYQHQVELARDDETRRKYHQERESLMLTRSRKFSIPTIEKSPNLYVSLSITGLRNLGNTCYINSMLQCLFATRLFRDLFISSKFQSFINDSKFPNTPKISNSFNLLFKKMYLNGGCSVVPTSFLKTCNILRPDLRIPDDQQDTQEFLMIILDRLHDELSNQQEVVNEYPNLLLYDENNLKVQNKEYKHWFDKNVIGNGLSPIDHIFSGQMENSLQCQRCGNSSYNYSTFYVLSLAIPKPSSTTFSRSKRVKLEECINMFTSDEVLSGENAWDCPKCGSSASSTISDSEKLLNVTSSKKKNMSSHNEHHRYKSKFFTLHTRSHRSISPFRKKTSPAAVPSSTKNEPWKSKKLITIKTLNFIVLPPILVIHLSRFYYDLTKKNNTVITYPLILNIVLKNNEVAKYRLYGIVNHSGNLISGHYTSLVNKEPNHDLGSKKQRWYYFDDETVKEERNHGDMDKGILQVSSRDVYVLFYERIYE